jgi:hypothetical protein
MTLAPNIQLTTECVDKFFALREICDTTEIDYTKDPLKRAADYCVDIKTEKDDRSSPPSGLCSFLTLGQLY